MFKKAAIRESKGDRLFMFLIYLFLTLVLIAVAVPLIYIVSSSFSSPQAVTSGKVWLFPVDFTLDGYKAVFNNPQIGVGYLNSLFYTVVGTLINVTLTIMLAYPLAKKSLYGRNFFMVLLVITMMFEGGLIPYYLVVKNLHLLDTRWAMILPGHWGYSRLSSQGRFSKPRFPMNWRKPRSWTDAVTSGSYSALSCRCPNPLLRS